MGIIATMTSKGQMTIPKEVRDELGLKPGDTVSMFIDGDKAIVMIAASNERLSILAGILGQPPAGAARRLEEIDEAIGDAVADDDERIRARVDARAIE